MGIAEAVEGFLETGIINDGFGQFDFEAFVVGQLEVGFDDDGCGVADHAVCAQIGAFNLRDSENAKFFILDRLVEGILEELVEDFVADFAGEFRFDELWGSFSGAEAREFGVFLKIAGDGFPGGINPFGRHFDTQGYFTIRQFFQDNIHDKGGQANHTRPDRTTGNPEKARFFPGGGRSARELRQRRSGCRCCIPALAGLACPQSIAPGGLNLPVGREESMADFFEVGALGFNPEAPGDPGTQEGGGDERVEEGGGADVFEQDGEEKGGEDRADFGDRGGEARARTPNVGGEDFSGEEVGHGVGAEIGHEIEEHESGEDEKNLGGAGEVEGEGGDEQADRAADESENLEADASDAVCEEDGGENADNKKDINERGTLGGEHVRVDDLGEIAGIGGCAADGCGEDGRGEDADAIGAEILEKPRDGGEDGGAAVFLFEEFVQAGFVVRVCGEFRSFELDAMRIFWAAVEQAGHGMLGFGEASANDEPMSALGNEKPSDQDKNGGENRGGIHHSPIGEGFRGPQNQVADEGAGESADGLETKGAEDQRAPVFARDAFGDDEVCGRVVAPEGRAHSKKKNNQPEEARAQGHADEECREEEHFKNKHHPASVMVGQSAEGGRAHEDAEERSGTHEALLPGGEGELEDDQGEGDPGHENDHAFKEFPGGGEPPDAPLHGGHGHIGEFCAVNPLRSFIQIFLNRPVLRVLHERAL